MRFTNDGKIFWATDLSTHSECEHRSVLEMGVALRKWDRPGQSEIRTELLEMRGREHDPSPQTCVKDGHGPQAVSARTPRR